MPLWGNVDTQAAKPKMPVERLYEAHKIAVAASQTANTTSINLGSAGAAAFAAGYLANGSIVLGNNVPANANVASWDAANTLLILSANTTANVIAGDIMQVNLALVYHANTYETTLNADTILVTSSRRANATVNVEIASIGWMHVRKKVNNDGTVRYLTETLVALANPVASNTASGNTSNTQVFTGV